MKTKNQKNKRKGVIQIILIIICFIAVVGSSVIMAYFEAFPLAP